VQKRLGWNPNTESTAPLFVTFDNGAVVGNLCSLRRIAASSTNVSILVESSQCCDSVVEGERGMKLTWTISSSLYRLWLHSSHQCILCAKSDCISRILRKQYMHEEVLLVRVEKRGGPFHTFGRARGPETVLLSCERVAANSESCISGTVTGHRSPVGTGLL
jgi:hypothetical protein